MKARRSSRGRLGQLPSRKIAPSQSLIEKVTTTNVISRHTPKYVISNLKSYNSDWEEDGESDELDRILREEAFITQKLDNVESLTAYDSMRSSADMESMTMDNENGKTLNRFVILPNSAFRMCWDLNMLFFLAYVAILTPFQMAFLGDQEDIAHPEDWPGFFAMDRLVDLVFLIDMVINFRSAWYEADGSVVTFDQKIAAKNYLRGWFTLDLFSLLPWEVIGILFNVKGDAALRFPKLLRLLRLIKILKLVRASRVVRRIEQNMGIKYGILRLCKFAVTLIVLAHWLACALMFITTFKTYENSQTEKKACISHLNGESVHSTWKWGLFCECHCTIGQTYVAALYWSTMTLTTIGYGDVSPDNATEMVFMVVAMLLGAAVFSFVVGTCCSLVEGLDKMGLQFQEEFDAVNDYMHLCGIDKNMRRRVRAYVWNYKDMSSRRNEGEILGLMSPALQQEFILHNYGTSIRAIPALYGAPDSFVVEMAHTATRKLYGPRDTISYQGSLNDPFYLLRKGEVIICRSPGPGHPVRFVQRLQGSGFWNERLLMFDSFADCSAKSMTFVEVVAFEAHSIRQILLRYPMGRNRVKQNVLRRLWRFSASKTSIKHAVKQLRSKGFGVYEVAHRASRAQGRVVSSGPPGSSGGGGSGSGSGEQHVQFDDGGDIDNDRSHLKTNDNGGDDGHSDHHIRKHSQKSPNHKPPPSNKDMIETLSKLSIKKSRDHSDFPFGYIGDGSAGDNLAQSIMERHQFASNENMDTYSPHHIDPNNDIDNNSHEGRRGGRGGGRLFFFT
mmetsp:Transcript_34820/g.44907  ORF Transcript_34820/g.44907 Transcript_34820/m.44907 type:complete len:786 (+) Transcript_34820:112-2469(+)